MEFELKIVKNNETLTLKSIGIAYLRTIERNIIDTSYLEKSEHFRTTITTRSWGKTHLISESTIRWNETTGKTVEINDMFFAKGDYEIERIIDEKEKQN